MEPTYVYTNKEGEVLLQTDYNFPKRALSQCGVQKRASGEPLKQQQHKALLVYRVKGTSSVSRMTARAPQKSIQIRQ